MSPYNQMLVFEVKIGVGRKYLKLLSFLILNVATCLSKIATKPETKFSSFRSFSDSRESLSLGFLINTVQCSLSDCSQYSVPTALLQQDITLWRMPILNTEDAKGWDKGISRGLAIPSPDQSVNRAGRQGSTPAACRETPVPCSAFSLLPDSAQPLQRGSWT